MRRFWLASKPFEGRKHWEPADTPCTLVQDPLSEMACVVGCMSFEPRARWSRDKKAQVLDADVEYGDGFNVDTYRVETRGVHHMPTR